MFKTKDFIVGMKVCTQTMNRRGRRGENSVKIAQSRATKMKAACAVMNRHLAQTRRCLLTIEAFVRRTGVCLPPTGRSLRLLGLSARRSGVARGLGVAVRLGLSDRASFGPAGSKPPASNHWRARSALPGGSGSRDAGGRCRALRWRDFCTGPGATQASDDRKNAIRAQRVDEQRKSSVLRHSRLC